MTGIEKLRRAVTLFSNCTETFNERWTADELLKIYAAYHASGWDITPDQWSDDQLMAALRAVVLPISGETV